MLAVAAITLMVRDRTVFRIFLRSGLGNRKRLALIIAGLMVGSAMISGALIMRSTMLTLSDNMVALSYGHVDETVTAGGPLGGPFFNESAYYSLLNASPPDAVRGLVPAIYATVSAFDVNEGVPYDNLGLLAEGGNASSLLGPFVTLSGATIQGVPAGAVIMDELAAQQLDARAGNTITVYAGNSSHNFTLFAVVRDNYRAYFDMGFNIFMNLNEAQGLFHTDQINMVAVVNTGSVLGAASLTSTAMGWLNSTLPSVSGREGVTLGAHPVMQDALSSLSREAGDISSLYLALSLFAVASGMILVVVILYTLAEERIRELGLLRAIGAGRRSIISGFMGEGFIYTLLSCTAGAFAGIGIGLVMVLGFVDIFGKTFSLPVRATGVLISSFTVTPSDLAIGFLGGSIVTYGVILASSFRLGGIASAMTIRGNLPPAPTGRRFLPLLLLMISVSMLLMLYSVLRPDVILLMLSISLLLLSISLTAQLFSAGRYFQLGGGLSLLLLWGLPYSWHYIIAKNASYYIYVESGIFLVISGIMLFMAFLPVLVSALSPRGRSSGPLLPALRQAVAYPAGRRLRTALSLALFSFVIFGIISVSVLGTMIDGAAVRTVQVQGGGYNFVLYSADRLNLSTPLSSSPSVQSMIARQSLIYDAGAAISYNGSTFVYSLLGLPDFGSTPFFSHNSYPFYSYLPQYGSPAGVWNAVEFNTSLAVIDMSLAGIRQGDFAASIPPGPPVPLGATLHIYSNGSEASVHVIGILDEFGLQGIFVSSHLLGSMGLLSSAYPVLFLKIRGNVSATAASVAIRHLLYPYNPVLVNLQLLTQQLTAAITGIVEMTEIFIALGLAAGTAGLGIMAMRSVVERYQHIGLLRTLGFSGRMVSASFMLEFLLLSLFGSAIGVAMGFLNSYIISTRLSSVLIFAFSPSTVAYLVLISAGLTAAAVAGSARAVARIRPSVALRYLE